MFTRIVKPNLKLSTPSYSVIKYHLSELMQLKQKCFSNNSNKNFLTTNLNSEGNKKKETAVPKITLLSGNDLNITTLEDARKLAKRRELKLVKMVDIDTKTHRPVYKLMTGFEYHEEDLKQRERKKAEKQNSYFKGEKILIVGQNITQHDLQTHCSKIIKWLDKKYEVRIVINGDIENIKKAENVYLFFEEKLTEYGRIVQKRQKGSDIKFQVIANKESKPNSDNKKKDAADSSI